MDDLISRSALREQLLTISASDGLYGMGIQIGVNEAIKATNEALAVDAVPVRHGRWEYRAIDTPNLGRKYEMYCTACGKTPDPKKDFYYCPMCGAKMDKENDNGKL